MMVWDAIKCWAAVAPRRQAIAPLSYLKLKGAIARCFRSLPEVKGKRVGLFIGNRPLWGIYDLALTLKGAVVVPVPTFFSREQIRYILSDARIDVLIIESESVARSRGIHDIFTYKKVIMADHDLETWEGSEEGDLIDKSADPQEVCKIIYTSGTTGRPKGVLISLRAIEAVTKSLIDRSGANMSDRHLTLLPLSTLVETIGGLYAPLVAGATIVYPKGSPAPENILFDPVNLKKVLFDASPTTLNLVPSLLEATLDGVRSMFDLPRMLRFVACGGAPLRPALRMKAREMGMNLYEGYGLSECASVVALNGIGMTRPGSVGKVLKHAEVTLSEEGEIMVSGAGVMAGYTDGTKRDLKLVATGDMGYIDEEGYLYVTGRKDNLIITGQGRNVSPEWVEAALYHSRSIDQVMVFANERGQLSAIIVPDPSWLDEIGRQLDINGGMKITEHRAVAGAMRREVSETLTHLPAYAAVQGITLLSESFTVENGLLGPDGTLKRKEILKTLGHASSVQLNTPVPALTLGREETIH